ncbi:MULTISPECIES: hypothetical protein [unclassified Paenibacillus]|uniref:hypothetical protein n=1 Tax=unclassified Paenibacillus TaxID=185978 RepID=UPI001AE3B83A|nr:MULTISPECIES: hypothetical protein [unclassified Paenibacillus]MBP1154851.1 hypothetical protein [Paenibacillus sp. PvP091]MBP1169765.1 hypothetical protein [Paenibacillus sp. PvR098]MBP2440793.1 hypothetical protein [Paenibacillus sp. PvP052]
MKASKVNDLPQQAKLTVVTDKMTDSNILKSLEQARYQLMARIATRMLKEGK